MIGFTRDMLTVRTSGQLPGLPPWRSWSSGTRDYLKQILYPSLCTVKTVLKVFISSEVLSARSSEKRVVIRGIVQCTVHAARPCCTVNSTMLSVEPVSLDK